MSRGIWVCSVAQQERLKELEQLLAEDANEAQATALRWVIHQPSVDSAVRLKAVRVLINWHRPWLSLDLATMLRDQRQPWEWRAQCVVGLARHFNTCLDSDSWKALTEARGSTDVRVRNTAVVEIARLCGEWRWRRTNPARFEIALRTAAHALRSSEPSTLLAGLRAVMYADLDALVYVTEKSAGDADRSAEIRVAALNALERVPRWESLDVMRQCLRDGDRSIQLAAKRARPFVLVAQLNHPDSQRVEDAFEKLIALGAEAVPALDQAIRGTDTRRKALSKEIMSRELLGRLAMKAVDRVGMKVYGADPEKKRAGKASILLNDKTRRIAIQGEFCIESGPLEFAAVCHDGCEKLHESVIALYCGPLDICYALFKCKYVWVNELKDKKGRVKLPKGAGVMLSVQYERTVHSPAGKRRETLRLPLQAFLWNTQAKRPMRESPWAFIGSRQVELPNRKRTLEAVLTGAVAAVRTDPSALLANPLDTAEQADVNPRQESGYYEMNRALAPKPGTKCVLIFEPWNGTQTSFIDNPSNGTPNVKGPKR